MIRSVFAVAVFALGASATPLDAASAAADARFVSSLAAREAAILKGAAVPARWRTVTLRKKYFYDVVRNGVMARTAGEVCQGYKQLLDDVLYGIEVRRANTRCLSYGGLAEFSGTVEALIELEQASRK